MTPALFRLAPTPAAMAALQPAEIQTLIRQVGLAPTKARNILALSQVCTMRGLCACKLAPV